MASKRMIRLLYITTVPVTLGFLIDHIAYMQNKGFGVSVLSSPDSGLSEFGNRQGIPVYGVPMRRHFSPGHDLIALARLIYYLVCTRPHIVHVLTPKAGLLGMLSAWLTRVPVRVYHIVGLRYETETGFRRRMLIWSEKIACACAQQVICVSHSLEEIVIESGLCKPAKISVPGNGSVNGVDAVGKFNPASIEKDTQLRVRESANIPVGALVLGYVGRIVRDKGIHELAEAWATLREQVPNLHLLVIGSFEPQDPVSSHVHEVFKNDPRVYLAGFVADTPPLYMTMDVLALPTYREGFGNVVIEAGAMVIPVVGTRVTGCVDAIVDGVTGTLVPARDAKSLTSATHRYLMNPELRQRHGKAARERVLQDFQQEPIWDAVYQVYLELLHKQGVSAQPAEQGSPINVLK